MRMIIIIMKAKSNKKKRKSSTTDCGGSGCPFMASRSAVSTLALHLLAQPSDIEDAGRLGAVSQTCAYYASRVSAFVCFKVVGRTVFVFESCWKNSS